MCQCSDLKPKSHRSPLNLKLELWKRIWEALDVPLFVLARLTFRRHDMRTNVYFPTHKHRSPAAYPRFTTSTPEIMAYPRYQQIMIAKCSRSSQAQRGPDEASQIYRGAKKQDSASPLQEPFRAAAKIHLSAEYGMRCCCNHLVYILYHPHDVEVINSPLRSISQSLFTQQSW